MIEVRDFNHICLFFVKESYHRRGVGKALYLEAKELIKQNGAYFIEVNASPFSENIYEKLGFKKTSDKMTVNGIRYIPMKTELL